ncbi:hypothetical protein ABT297_26320 [Dactylosporangium sp. NPDC000555]|uniref:hypothetical protein n=1 Tax=Dactylosporangium sp. NPDC000555 TaxID=3154260 RepID=UPI003317607F
MPADETEPRRRGLRHLRRYRRGRHSAARPRIGLYSAGVVAFAAIGVLFLSPGTTPDNTMAQAETAYQNDPERVADAENRASRRDARRGDEPGRQPSSPAGTQPQQSPAQNPPSPAKSTAAAPQPAASSPTVHAPIGGLNQTEMNNAVAIIRAGQQLDLPHRAFVVAIATALQESHLRNLANPNVPASLNVPNEGVGNDHDSVGLFQQRPSWGSVTQLMDPAESARRFYAALMKVSGWEQMPVTVAAQTVQVSAFPDAYAKWQTLAEQIVIAVA